MESRDIYRLILYTGIHIELREQVPESKAEFDIITVKSKASDIRRTLDGFDFFHGILNKNILLDEAIDEYSASMKEGIDDEIMSSYILNKIQDESKDNKKVFFDCITWLSHINDKQISFGERDILKHFYNIFQIDNKSFDQYITDNIIKCSKEIKKTYKNVGKKSPILLIVSILFFVTSVGVFAFFYLFKNEVNAPLKRRLANISYKKIYFDRYISAGNFNEGERSAQTGKLVIFYIKGSADIQFDLRNIKLQQSANGFEAVYSNPAAKEFRDTKPFTVDINIDPKNIVEVIEISPKELNECQKEIAGATVGLVASVGGAYVGGKLGTAIGTVSANPIAPLVGGIAGTGVGAIGGGLAGYILTKKYLTRFKVTGAITQSKKIEILQKTKTLIAAEIFFDKDLSEELKNSFENYVKVFYSQFGIEIDGIKYLSLQEV